MLKKRKAISWACKRADWDRYTKTLEAKVEGMPEGGSLVEKVESMTQAMLEAAKESIPKKMVSRYNKPYWDDELGEVRRQRDEQRKGLGRKRDCVEGEKQRT